MTTWAGSILLSEGQTARVDALVSSSGSPSVTIHVDAPEVTFSVVWDGETFVTSLPVGADNVAGYTFTVGEDGSYVYQLHYTSPSGGLSTATVTTPPDCEISANLTGG